MPSTIGAMTADPSVAVARLSNAALQAAHDQVHRLIATKGVVGPGEAEAHHLIADQLRERGLGHPTNSDGLHDVTVTMSKVRVPLRTLAKMIGPAEVKTIANLAMANGTSFADVYELLTANGWMLRAEPAASNGDEDEPEDEGEANGEDEGGDEPEDRLQPRQAALYEAYEAIAEEYGKFDQSNGPNGAHYVAKSPFQNEGLACANCVFYEGGRGCEVVSGSIAPEAICKLWVIDAGLLKARGADVHKEIRETADGFCVYSADGSRSFGCYPSRPQAEARLAQIESFKAASYDPPEGVREEAQRALRWIAEGHAGSGFTAVGRARARDLASGRSVSETTLRRMASFFARHEVDKEGKGWSPGEDGYPSAGRVAWAAWGGDPGRSWASRVLAGADVGKHLSGKHDQSTHAGGKGSRPALPERERHKTGDIRNGDSHGGVVNSAAKTMARDNGVMYDDAPLAMSAGTTKTPEAVEYVARSATFQESLAADPRAEELTNSYNKLHSANKSLNEQALGISSSPEAARNIENIDYVISQHGTPAPNVMMRGARSNNVEDLSEMSLQQGDTFVEPKYGTWTQNGDVARGFAGGGDTWNDTDDRFERFTTMTVLKNGSVSTSIPGYSLSMETVLPRNTKYRVSSVRDIETNWKPGQPGRVRMLELEIVP